MSDDKRKQPMRPVAVEQLPWESWEEGTRFGGRTRKLSDSKRDHLHVGVVMEELPPGKQSCPLHYHHLEEEHVWILEGTVTLRLGDERIPMTAGDFVTFRAGLPVGHCFVNEGDATCRYLVIGERNPHEVCVYPDSNKIAVDATGEVYDKGATRGYWDGEPTGGS
jgi:uncharacterized cupin superfamily protein